MLERRSPAPKNKKPDIIITRGPVLSIKKPTMGPRMPPWILVAEKAPERAVLEVFKASVMGMKKALKPNPNKAV